MEAILELLKSLLGEWWIWTIIVFFIAKFVPDEKLGQWGLTHGKWITLKGNKHLSFIYVKLEAWVLHSIFGVYFKNLKEGIESDN